MPSGKSENCVFDRSNIQVLEVFPDAGMLHTFHVALAYLRNSAATRALWQNQPCHKLLPSGLKLHQKNDDMEARRCHNSATVGAPPRLPTELFVRLRITQARGRGDKQEVRIGR